MGTSGKYGGSTKGLLPSWLNQPDGGADPPAGLPSTPSTTATQPQAPQQPLTAPAQIPLPAYTGTYKNARSAFTRFVNSRDTRALQSAVSKYVSQGAGGSRRAMSAMGASRGVANRLVGIARDAQTLGAAAAVQKYNLGLVTGVPAADVFLNLLEVMCPPGGSISEAIARNAMLAAIEHLADAGVTDFDALTPEQWETFVLDFVTCSVEDKVINEIGARLVDAPDSVTDLDAVEAQLHDFVVGCVRDSLGTALDDIASLSDAQIATTVDEVYTAAFDFLELLGDGT